ncbi:MAG: hypothetical protein FWD75_10090 [Propionibacteriaceae bacterium]|nr:hypothetical protein [Propionibacteriaceae bacterium]
MDNEKLIDAVTRIIMERLAESGSCHDSAATSVVTFGDVPECLVSEGFTSRQGSSASDTDGADFIVLTQAAFRAFHGGAIPAGLAGVAATPSEVGAKSCCAGAVVDLTGKKVISENQVRGLNMPTGWVVKVDGNAIVTALARDYVISHGGKIVS